MQINQLDEQECSAGLFNCCASKRWVELMLEARPFKSTEQLFQKAYEIWTEECSQADWLEAFEGHPRIGDLKSLAAKYADTKSWAGREQAGVQQAGEMTLRALAKGNKMYEAKFGYIFIVCATGKSAAEMLQLLKKRLANHPDDELLIAMQEQAKITTIRLKKWLQLADN